MRKRHDWEAIKRDYVQGYVREDGVRVSEPSYANVAVRNDISAILLRKKGADEGWKEQRNKFLAVMEHVAKERRIDQLSQQVANFDAGCCETAEALLDIIRGKMAQSVRMGEDGKREIIASASDIQALSSALVKAQAVGRLAMGESTENTRTEWAIITPELGMA